MDMTLFRDGTWGQPGRWEFTGTREANSCPQNQGPARVWPPWLLTNRQTQWHKSILPLRPSLEGATATSYSVRIRLRISYSVNLWWLQAPHIFLKKIPSPNSLACPEAPGLSHIHKSWFHQKLFVPSAAPPFPLNAHPSLEVLLFPHCLVFSWVPSWGAAA